MRLIDENGTQVGIVSVREAIMMAEERGFDLVEVAPNAVPPVCRLLDYGKFRYEQSKKEREARKNQKQSELKQIRLMPKTDDHDLATKANQAKKFLLAGDKVKFNVRFRGREMAHPEIGRKMLEAVAEQLRDIAVVEQKPLMEGRVLSLLVAPNAKVLKAAQQAQKAKIAQSKASAKTDEPGQSESPVDAEVEVDDELMEGEDLDDGDFADDDFDDDEFEEEDFDDEDLDEDDEDDEDDEGEEEERRS
ncbi:translation initiation factor IF-3 [Candidatus Chloroploca mongolica]|uniref:translation initiation factor IF-3 n=1 Tax=Candidatus Chloroploca mongolica TaxID=2528176 RepID=UPI0035311A79